MAKIVEFNGCSDAQANWGQGQDPRKHLLEGAKYEVVNEVVNTEVHSWHTLYWLKGFEMPFNSGCFEDSPQ